MFVRKAILQTVSLYLLISQSAIAAEEMFLDILSFSNRSDSEFVMFPTRVVPESLMKAEVEVEFENTRIRLESERLRPAVFLGGDVTCYVVWAINRDGISHNLGELWVDLDKDKEKFDFTTSMTSFALIVTAESYSMVDQPSELVVFWNDRITDPQVESEKINFDQFEPAPQQEFMKLTSNPPSRLGRPVELTQAEVANKIAIRLNADQYAPVEFTRSTIFLQRAKRSVSDRKDLEKAARLSFFASSRALFKTTRQVKLESLKEQLGQAQSRADDLDSRLELTLAENEEQQENINLLRSENNRALIYARELEEQREGLRNALSELEVRLSDLRKEKQQLEMGLQSVQDEKRALQDRMLEALSTVAETQQTDRGFVVKLPDILFDVGKDSLKQDARIVLAKLVGILLIMREHNLRIEGHTDSTGSTRLNLELSQRRAESVASFLEQQGIRSARMKTKGYGKQRPVADNRTAEGRRQNRRVEIIIAEGEILELNP